jgi:hypothetical protein
VETGTGGQVAISQVTLWRCGGVGVGSSDGLE